THRHTHRHTQRHEHTDRQTEKTHTDRSPSPLLLCCHVYGVHDETQGLRDLFRPHCVLFKYTNNIALDFSRRPITSQPTHAYTHTHTHTHTHTYLHTHIPASTHTHSHTHIPAHNTDTHTHTQTKFYTHIH